MGLDQYLYAKDYVSGSSYSTDEKEKSLYEKLLEAVNAQEFIYQDLPSIQMQVKVGYWRKANQIHNWFVTNVQDGEDDCKEYYVPRESLEDLLNTCREVLLSKHPDVANDLLPATSGFFFGSTEIDEWYWAQLDDTIEQISRLLKTVPSDWDFYYQSSW